MWDEKQPGKSKYMIEPDGARIAHHRRDGAAEYLEFLGFELVRVEGCQSPVLSGRIIDIGRCADRQLANNSALRAPRIGPGGIDPDSNIEEEPQGELKATGQHAALTQLAVSEPLDELVKAQFSLLGAELSNPQVSWLAPFGGPIPPWAIKTAAQGLERGEAGECAAAAATEGFEIALVTGISRLGFLRLRRAFFGPL